MRQAKRLGIAHAVHIQPGMSFDKLALYFRAADLVVYPSYHEGQGLIPLEALASGTPVVTVNQAPLTEMIDEEVGGLFACGDHEDLASWLSTIASMRLKNARNKWPKVVSVLDLYTYEHNAVAYERIYQQAIE